MNHPISLFLLGTLSFLLGYLGTYLPLLKKRRGRSFPSNLLIPIICLGTGSLFLAWAGQGVSLWCVPSWVNVLLTLLWGVGVAIGFSLLPVRGLPETQGLVLGILFLILGWQGGRGPLVPIGIFLCGLLLGRLRWCLKGGVHLGRQGSFLLGWLLASLVPLGNYTRNNLLAFLSPLLFFSLPLYGLLTDGLGLLKKRLKKISTLYRESGLTPEAFCLWAFFWSAGLALTGLFMSQQSFFLALTALVWIGSLYVGLASDLSKAGRREVASRLGRIKLLWGKARPAPRLSPTLLFRRDLLLLRRLFVDGFLLNVGWVVGYLIRFNGLIDPKAFYPYLKFWAFLTSLHLFALWKGGLYQEGLPLGGELFWKLLQATGMGILLSLSLLYVARVWAMAFPTSILLWGLLLNPTILWGWRVYIRTGPLQGENSP